MWKNRRVDWRKVFEKRPKRPGKTRRELNKNMQRQHPQLTLLVRFSRRKTLMTRKRDGTCKFWLENGRPALKKMRRRVHHRLGRVRRQLVERGRHRRRGRRDQVLKPEQVRLRMGQHRRHLQVLLVHVLGRLHRAGKARDRLQVQALEDHRRGKARLQLLSLQGQVRTPGGLYPAKGLR